MFQLRFNNCTLACRLVSCDTMFGFWLADGFYPDDFLQGFHRESTTYFERQYIYVQLLTSILMTRPTITECNHRSRSHYQTRDPRALTATWAYQKVPYLPINRPMRVMLFTILVNHMFVISTIYIMLSRSRFTKLYIMNFLCITYMFTPY